MSDDAHNEIGPADAGTSPARTRRSGGRQVMPKARSIIPHMTLERLAELRDGVYEARLYAAREWHLALTHDQVLSIALCALGFLDGRLTVGQVDAMAESDAFQQLAGVGVQHQQPKEAA